MKKTAYLLFAALLVAFVSCDKGDMEIKKLNRGEGIWEITSMRYETYDSLGQHVVSTNTVSAPGELVFFKTASLDALFDYYLVVANMKDPATGNISAYPGQIYYDGNRVSMEEDSDPYHSFPNELEGVWTITDDGRKKQEWTSYALGTNGELTQKTTIYLKKK